MSISAPLGQFQKPWGIVWLMGAGDRLVSALQGTLSKSGQRVTPTPNIHFRVAAATDVPVLATLFHETVMTHGPVHYTETQTAAWAAAALETEHFRQFILGVQTWVAETPSGIVGFGGLAPDGYIASLYVHRDGLGQGIGSAILQQLIEQARRDRCPRLYAEASEFSLGLFQKFGFQHNNTEVVERLGIPFTRYRVERVTTPGDRRRARK